MGVFRYPIEIAARSEGPFERFEALVGTGSLYTWVPSAILRRLGLEPTGRRPFLVADGRIIERDAVEAVIQIDGQKAHTFCVFADEEDQVLLGAYTLEGLGLAVDPVNKRLVPMPAIAAMGLSRHGGVQRGSAHLAGESGGVAQFHKMKRPGAAPGGI